jgi:hypothetical protein
MRPGPCYAVGPVHVGIATRQETEETLSVNGWCYICLSTVLKSGLTGYVNARMFQSLACVRSLYQSLRAPAMGGHKQCPEQHMPAAANVRRPAC